MTYRALDTTSILDYVRGSDRLRAVLGETGGLNTDVSLEVGDAERRRQTVTRTKDAQGRELGIDAVKGQSRGLTDQKDWSAQRNRSELPSHGGSDRFDQT